MSARPNSLLVICMIAKHVRCPRAVGLGRGSLIVAASVACFAFLFLWGRSNGWRDSLLVWIPTGETIFVQSRESEMSFAICHSPPISMATTRIQSVKRRTFSLEFNPEPRGEFDLAVLPLNTTIVLPHWYLMLGCGILACVAYSPCFSVRTMLLTMTVLAVLLGVNAHLM